MTIRHKDHFFEIIGSVFERFVVQKIKITDFPLFFRRIIFLISWQLVIHKNHTFDKILLPLDYMDYRTN